MQLHARYAWLKTGGMKTTVVARERNASVVSSDATDGVLNDHVDRDHYHHYRRRAAIEFAPAGLPTMTVYATAASAVAGR